ncbi:MAG: hypothetical protein ACXABD_22045 [Candidatus Thorarchaeota archaeon]|jgi:hypothetical protein
MKHNIKKLVNLDWVTIEDIWEFVDNIPDDGPWVEHKKNIHALFKKNGDPKAKASSPSTDADYQTMHTTSVFIRKGLRHVMSMERRRKRVEMVKKNIKDVKEGKDVPRRVTKDLKYAEPKTSKMNRRRKEKKDVQ